MLSNLELIREFINLSLQKREVLLSNPVLKGETVFGTNQLIAKAEGIIVTIKHDSSSILVFIKANSSQWEAINQILAEYKFVLTGEIDQRGFYQYEYCQVPEGYEMHCSKAVILWRAWWKYRKYVLGRGIPLELLIRIRKNARYTWYPIKNLVISDGVIYVKTLGSEVIFHSEDLITWLSKIEKKSPNQDNISIYDLIESERIEK